MSNWSTQRGRVHMGKPSCGRAGKCSLSQTFRVLGNEGDHMSTLGASYPIIPEASQEAGRLTGDWRLVYIK